MRTPLLAAAAGMMGVIVWSAQAEAATSIEVVDSNSVGTNTALALDKNFLPVIAYYDTANGQLKLTHCNDRECAGNNEPMVTVDGEGDVGADASLALDASGNPVVSYFDRTNGQLKVAHCNDADCSGGGESIVAVDHTGTAGVFTSLELDAAGNPVVSYHDYGKFDLKLLHCNDPDCSGGGESIVTVDSVNDVGSDTSLALDAMGNPVVSYHDFTNYDLMLVHCNDPDCAGDDESIVTVDRAGTVGMYTSLALDAAGDPVVSYYDATNHDLKVTHCNDPDCAGDDESIVAVDTAGDVGAYTSLALDAAGDPVVSYYDATNGDLKVAHCNDGDCAGADEQINVVDGAGNVGLDTSMRLDFRGTPVVSYRDLLNDDLKLAHCDNTLCAPATCVGEGATIVGTAGDDLLTGTPGDDVIAGGAGDDTIDGLGGHDIVCGGGGGDTIDGGDGPDLLFGGEEDGDLGDTMSGDAGDDFLDGGTAGDLLQGGTGSDVLLGGDEPVGDDVLDGGPGDDQLFGEGGVDTVTYADSAAGVSANLTTTEATGDGTDVLFDVENLIGSPFDDTLVGDGARNAIDGGLAGDDVLDGAAGVDTVSYAGSGVGVSANLTTGLATADGTDELSGFENLVGSPFADTLFGDEGPNLILGLDGIDGLDGRAGNDRLDGGADADILFGSAGDDVFVGAAGEDTLNFARSNVGITADLRAGRVSGEGSDRVAGVEHLGGSAFDDVLTGNAGSNSIAAGAGADVIVGGDGDDAAYGDEGADRVDGGRGDDLAFGGAGADVITGSDGDDTLHGSSEIDARVLDRGDRISGGRGEDLIDGGGANDVLAGGPGVDHLSGAAGIDTVTYVDAAVGVSASLRTHRASGQGDDALFTIENLVGSRFRDSLVGQAGANRIRGGRGDDRLVGLAGNDVLDGQAGFDRGNGGAGRDVQRRCEVVLAVP